jgi:hypothetical protein
MACQVAQARDNRGPEKRPKVPHSTVFSEDEEAVIVAFRRHALLLPDDCLYVLQPSIQHLTRSSLHRCLQRYGISRLLDVEGDEPKRQQFKRSPFATVALASATSCRA